MVSQGQMRAGMVSDDLRSEFDLSPETHAVVNWIVQGGLMDRDDLRTMLGRENNISKYGIDVAEWPSLAESSRQIPRRIRPARTAAPAMISHRGLGAFVPQRQQPDEELVVLDWGLRREEHTPPPARPPRARTTSPEPL